MDLQRMTLKIKDILCGFVITYRIPALFEYLLFLIPEFQIWSLVISNQLSLVSDNSLDAYTRFLHHLFDVVSLRHLIIQEYSIWILAIIGFYFFLFCVFLVGFSITTRENNRYAIENKTRGYAGLVQVNMLYFWINLALIEIIHKNTGNAYLYISYILLAINNSIGLLCSGYSISPFFTKNLFSSVSQNFQAVNFGFRAIITLFNFLELSRESRTLFAIFSGLYYAVQLISLLSKTIYYKLSALKFKIVCSAIGLLLTISYIIMILGLEDNQLRIHSVLYFETLLLPLTFKVSNEITRYISASALERFMEKKPNKMIDIISLISALDYYLSPKTLTLNSKNTKLLYLIPLVSTAKNKPSSLSDETEHIKLEEHEKLSNLKNSLICQLLEHVQNLPKQEPILKIFLAEIYLEEFDEFQKAAFILEGCKTNIFIQGWMIKNLRDKIITQYKNRLSLTLDSADIQIYVENENIKEKLFEHITASILLQSQFLNRLYNPDGKIEELLTLVLKSEVLCNEIETLRKKLNIISSLEILPYYALYMASVQNLPYSAEIEVNEYLRRTESNLMISKNKENKEIDLMSYSNIVFKFSMSKQSPGRILHVSDSIKLLGWDHNESSKVNIIKFLPGFLNLSEKNLIESFLELTNLGILFKRSNFGFLISKHGYLVPCDIKLFMDPLQTEDLVFLAFCQIHMNGRFAITEHDKIIGLTQNLIEELQEDICSYDQDVLNAKKVTVINTMHFKSPLQKLPSIQRLNYKNTIDEYPFTLFSRRFKFLKLHPILEGTNEFQTKPEIDDSSSYEDVEDVSEGDKVYKPKQEFFKSMTSNRVYDTNDGLFKTEEEEINKEVKPFYRMKTVKRTMRLSSVSPDPKEKKRVKEENFMNHESSITYTLNSKYYRKLQNSISYTPQLQFSRFLGFMNITLFMVSSIMLMVYFFNLQNEFKKITQNLSTIFYSFKHLQMFIESKRSGNVYYFADLGLIRIDRYASVSAPTIYDPMMKYFGLNYTKTLADASLNFTENMDQYDSTILDLYFANVIKIKENSPYEPPSMVINLPTFVSKIINTNYKIYTSLGSKFDKKDLNYLILNSQDDALIQFEKIAEASYLQAQSHIDSIVSKIGICTGVIAIIGLLNFCLLILKENRTRLKKKYLFNMLSLLDDREIIRIHQILVEFLVEIKKIHPKVLALSYYNKVIEVDLYKDHAKKNAKFGNSSLKRFGTLKVPTADIVKSVLSLLILIAFMILPFILLLIIFISSGQKNQLKKYVEVQYHTEYNFYEMRLLMTNAYSYYGFNGTTTLRNKPIGEALSEISEHLTNFQSYLANFQEIFQSDYISQIVSGNICLMRLDPFCEVLGAAAASRGLIGINSYELDVFRRIRANFDSSPKGFFDIYLAINHPDGFISEIIDVLYAIPLFDILNLTLFNLTTDLADNIQTKIVLVIICFFAINLVFGTYFTRALGLWMNREREKWIKFPRRMPYTIAVNSKIWLAYLNDFSKRNFE